MSAVLQRAENIRIGQDEKQKHIQNGIVLFICGEIVPGVIEKIPKLRIHDRWSLAIKDYDEIVISADLETAANLECILKRTFKGDIHVADPDEPLVFTNVGPCTFIL